MSPKIAFRDIIDRPNDQRPALATYVRSTPKYQRTKVTRLLSRSFARRPAISRTFAAAAERTKRPDFCPLRGAAESRQNYRRNLLAAWRSRRPQPCLTPN